MVSQTGSNESGRDIRTRLLALDTCSVSDALDRLGMHAAVLGLRFLAGDARFGGRAVTVKLGAKSTSSATPRHLGTRAIEAARRGDVIVVDHGGREDAAGWGGLLSLGASLQGVAGVIVDGAVRDVDEARALGLPIVARSSVPVTARGRVNEVSTNERVFLAGVAVSARDLVLADGSGVVVVPSERADDVLDAAEAIAERETKIAKEIRSGRPITDAMAAEYEQMLEPTEGV